MKKLHTYKQFVNESVNEIRTSMISGTSGRTIDSLEDRKYELKKDVKGAMIGDFVNVTLPKGTIIYNLPGGVFADHFSLKDRYTTKSSQGPQWFDKPKFKGVSIRQMPETLAAIEKNSKVLESVNEAKFTRLPKDLSAMWNLKNSVESMVGTHDAGSDYDPKVMRSIEEFIKEIKKSAKSFKSKEEVAGTVYETKESNLNEATVVK